MRPTKNTLKFILILSASCYGLACAPSKGESTGGSTGTCGIASVSSNQVQAISGLGIEQAKFEIERAAFSVASNLGLEALDLESQANPFADDDRLVLLQGTELVAIVDHTCTKQLRGSYSNEAISQKITSPETIALENSGVGLHAVTYTLEKNMVYEELESLINNDPCVITVSTNKIHKPLAVPNDTYYANQSHLTDTTNLRFASAYDKFYVSPGLASTATATIAIIDTGVDIDHPDIASNAWVNTAETAGNSIDDDGNGKTDDVNGWNFATNTNNPRPNGSWSGVYHGTHVAGLAAGRINNSAGIAGILGTNVKIMALNVFGATDSASTTNIDNAILYAANNGATVINLSLGGSFPSASTQSALAHAVNTKGAFVVAAAGNSYTIMDADHCYSPAAYANAFSGMLSVGSIDVATGNKSSFSTYSSTLVEIAAPGAGNSANSNCTGGVLSTIPTALTSACSVSGYDRLMGTSMASPIVAGAAGMAMVFKKSVSGTTLTNVQIESLLLSTAATKANLTTVFKNGKVLDLKNLADSISP